MATVHKLCAGKTGKNRLLILNFTKKIDILFVKIFFCLLNFYYICNISRLNMKLRGNIEFNNFFYAFLKLGHSNMYSQYVCFAHAQG